MNIRQHINFSLILVLLSPIFLGSCKKSDKNSLSSADPVSVPIQGRINKSFWLNAFTGFFCGGEKDKTGYIFKTIDGGISWHKVYSSDSKSLYDIFILNDTIAYSCGDKLLLLKSKDNGNTWQEVIYPFTPKPYNILPLRCIFGNYRFMMIIGGENYDAGNVLWLESDQLRWVWHFDHEFRTGINFTTENYLLCGYGTSWSTNDHGYSYKASKFEGDYFTSSATINDHVAYVCGYNGGIYKTIDAGETWQKIFDENKLGRKRKHFNGIYFSDELNGWVVGNEGEMMRTKDGKNWEQLESVTDSDILSIVSDANGGMMISSAKGELIRIKP